MRKPLFPIPLEYVVSAMSLADRNGGITHGVVISPRFEGDKDGKFEGSQGSLSIEIHKSATSKLLALEVAIEYLQAFYQFELIKYKLSEQLKQKSKRKRHK